MVVILSLKETFRLFYKESALFSISTSSAWGSPFLHILTNTYYHLTFNYSYPVGMKWHFTVFLMTNDVKYFYVAIGHVYVCIIGRNVLFAHF